VADDFGRWKTQFGETNPGSGGVAGGVAVPEPAAWLLCLFAAFVGVAGSTCALERRAN